MRVAITIYLILFVVYLGKIFLEGIDLGLAKTSEFWVGWTINALSIFVVGSALFKVFPKILVFWVVVITILLINQIIALLSSGLFVSGQTVLYNVLVGLKYMFLVLPPIVISAWNIKRCAGRTTEGDTL